VKRTQARRQADLAVCQAMADAMEDYLLGERLFRQLIVPTPLGTRQPKMTIGGFLDLYRRLQAEVHELSAEEREQLRRIWETFRTMRRRYAARYANKLRRELRSNLDSWRWFLQDCAANPERCREEYPREARIRARIDLLLSEAYSQGVDVSNELDRLSELDARLRRFWRKGEFIWRGEDPSQHPPEREWYLYGGPASE